MKKTYSKPVVVIEVYEMNTDIAANCGQVLTLGPEAPGYMICDEFKGAFGDDDDFATFSLRNTPFYEDGAANCDCYYTSGGKGYFTS